MDSAEHVTSLSQRSWRQTDEVLGRVPFPDSSALTDNKTSQCFGILTRWDVSLLQAFLLQSVHCFTVLGRLCILHKWQSKPVMMWSTWEMEEDGLLRWLTACFELWDVFWGLPHSPGTRNIGGGDTDEGQDEVLHLHLASGETAVRGGKWLVETEPMRQWLSREYNVAECCRCGLNFSLQSNPMFKSHSLWIIHRVCTECIQGSLNERGMRVHVKRNCC